MDHFSLFLNFLCLFLFNREVRPLLNSHPANLSAERGTLLLLLGGRARLPDEDGGRHAGDQLVPGRVELRERDDLAQSRLVETVQEFPGLRAEEVDGPQFSGVIVGELGVGIAASKHDVSQRVPAGLDGSEVLELTVGSLVQEVSGQAVS